MTPDMAFSIIEKEAGTHFDPTLAKLFLSMKEEILIILTVFGQ
jgi:HD-GYP domain-containing protein (c-di-GMP phosphodiesterase class II)